MVPAFLTALSEAFDPRFRRTLAVSLLLTAAVFVALGTAMMLILDHTQFFDGWFFNRAIELRGGVAILGLTWLLFPAVATFVLGFFLDGVISAREARRLKSSPAFFAWSLSAVSASIFVLASASSRSCSRTLSS